MNHPGLVLPPLASSAKQVSSQQPLKMASEPQFQVCLSQPQPHLFPYPRGPAISLPLPSLLSPNSQCLFVCFVFSLNLGNFALQEQWGSGFLLVPIAILVSGWFG